MPETTQFVRQRIENRSQLATLIIPPRDVAVHPIADGGKGERNNRQQTVHLVALFGVVEHLHTKNGISRMRRMVNLLAVVMANHAYVRFLAAVNPTAGFRRKTNNQNQPVPRAPQTAAPMKSRAIDIP